MKGAAAGGQAGAAGASVNAPHYVRAIAPYQGGRPIEEVALELGCKPESIIKLASNENPLGMAPGARAAAAAALADVGRYPDGNGAALKSALSQRLNVPVSWLTVGNGSNDILEMAASLMLAPGASCVYSQHAFAIYALATQARGARAIETPARELGHDLAAMRAAIQPCTRLIYIANPNNPTGTLLAPDALRDFLEAVPPQAVVVLDEAYNEYLPPPARYDSLPWVRRYPNLIVSRTFSKVYGLAGLRVGYAVAQPDLTDLLNRIRQPFNVNSVAQAAARAALDDDEFVRRSVELNESGRTELCRSLGAMGLQLAPANGNFVLVRVGAAAAVYQHLLGCGVIVRPVASYGLPEWLRVTVGLPEENARFLRELPGALAAANR
ncbi:MAG TPA: histidinol-phosphate transaminase [Burkholderiaceae bacterium]|jgi:histidinol-phosphate aminotransferase|nr:histidinol-phosphate transaminase [Burkholderiaceae bacterium]